jgi:hypothetical protein
LPPQNRAQGKCLNCGNETTWRGKYLNYCSLECSKHSEKRKFVNLGKKQSLETIEKRISNTNQIKKEETRKSTLLQKYGSLNTDEALTETQKAEKYLKIQSVHQNKKHSDEHHKKIIATKKANNTLKHTDETKNKIKNRLLDYYQNNIDVTPNVGKTIKENNKNGYVTGKINNLYYRSSYEKKFIEYCISNNIKIESAETKEFRLEYYINDKRHYYYPDFYLLDLKIIIEIKPLSMLNENNNIEKLDVGLSNSKYPFYFVTEEELNNLDEFFMYI